jgi:hypothetical protein
MKGWFVLIDGKNEHDGPMEDVPVGLWLRTGI